MAYLPGFKIETKVVGVTYEGRQDIVAKCQAGESILLKREPTNPYDPNAIRVERGTGEQIGYIGKHLAADVAPELDKNGESVPALIKEITGGYDAYSNRGVIIEFTIPQPQHIYEDKEDDNQLSTYTNSIGIKFILIPRGTFEMGVLHDIKDDPSASAYYAEFTNDNYEGFAVKITRLFWIGECPVTQKQWQAVMGENPSHFKGPDKPVENVCWEDIQVFLDKLNRIENTNAYRLPTEAEWEYACRAGSDTKYFFGKTGSEIVHYAWTKENSDGRTHKVGQKKPNNWGLYDVYGNVYELCQDWFGEYEEFYSQKDPTGPSSGTLRVMRGDCWSNEGKYMESGHRNKNYPGINGRSDGVGFRLVRAHSGNEKSVESGYFVEAGETNKPYRSKAEDRNLVPTTEYPHYRYPFDDFNPVQSRVYHHKDNPNNMIIGANTSAGKTIAAELLIDSTLENNKRVIYMSPLKALTEEKFADWKHRYSNEKLMIMTGDYELSPANQERLKTCKIIVMTSEMMDSRTRKFDSERNEWMKEVGLVVVDESHILTTSRGDAVETGIMRFTAHNTDARIVFLSATMPNLLDLGDWLTSLNGKKTDIIQSNWRPVELQMHYREYLNVTNGNGNFDYRTTESKKMEIAIGLVLTKPKEKFLVFVHSKNTGRSILKQLRDLEVDAEFHNADLGLKKRRRIEASFKDRENGIRVLVSTSTTAWGVNLPARNVVIVGIHRGMSEVDELDIIQMAGRAGRYNIDDEGHVYLILPTGKTNDWRNIFKQPRPITSVLNDRGKLAFHVLAEIYRKAIKTEADLFDWYRRSLSYRQGLRQFSKDEAEGVLQDLKRMNMIYEKEGRLRPGRLGIISAIMYYPPHDIYAWCRNFTTVLVNNLDSNAFALAWALGDIPSNKSFVPRDLVDLRSDWNSRLAGLGIRFYTDTVISVEAAYNCLEGQRGTGMVRSKMREILNDARRILNTFRMIDERYAKWDKSVIWEELESKLIQQNKN